MPAATSSSETPPSKKHMLHLSGLYAASTVRSTSLALSLLFHRGPHGHHRDHCHSVLLFPSSDVGIGCRLCLHDVWSQSRCVCPCEINWQEMCNWIFYEVFWHLHLSFLSQLTTTSVHQSKLSLYGHQKVYCSLTHINLFTTVPSSPSSSSLPLSAPMCQSEDNKDDDSSTTRCDVQNQVCRPKHVTILHIN